MPSALVIDDHPVTHLGCQHLLGSAGFDPVLDARDMRSAYGLAENHQPDLILLDLGLPGIGGLDMIVPLQSRVAEAKILIFSMNDQPVFARRAIAAGARGYLSKNAPPDEFRHAVTQVMAGQIHLSADMALRMAALDAPGSADPLQKLTPRENQVLQLLGEGADLQSIADRINVSYKTAANVSATLKKKLGANSLNELIRIAIEAFR